MNPVWRLLLIRRLNHNFYKWDRATLWKHQVDRSARILDSARKNSPYYRRILSGQNAPSLSSVPIMNKEEMMAHFDEINTASFRRDELEEFKIRQEREGRLDLYRGRFSVGLSSGTSGNRSLTVLSEDERSLYGCLLWARNGIPRHIKKRRVLFALRTNNPAFMEVGSFGVKLFYVDYTRKADELVEIINERDLNILAGPPSLLSMIAEQRRAIKHRIDTLISYAEVLFEDTRAILEAAFDAPVVQIYQGSEGFIGSTCRMGRLHLNEDVMLVELEEAGDSIGQARNVILTDLYRTTQPIIRYSLNDVLELSDELCECGSCFRVIDRIHGRTDDIFHLKGTDGSIRYLFPDYVRRSINQASDQILEYQALQHSIDSIEIRLLLKEGANRPQIEESVLRNLRWWSSKASGVLGKVSFAYQKPERNPGSHKLIRVVRMF